MDACRVSANLCPADAQAAVRTGDRTEISQVVGQPNALRSAASDRAAGDRSRATVNECIDADVRATDRFVRERDAARLIDVVKLDTRAAGSASNGVNIARQ